MEPQTPDFLDVPTLLASSHPRPHRPWIWFFAAGLLLLLILSGVTHSKGGALAVVIDVLFALSLGGFLVLAALLNARMARSVNAENARLDDASELITLRRWPEAAIALQGLLSQPMRSQGSRVQALIYLSGLLGRYHRFDDAIQVYDHLLTQYTLDPRTQHALKLGRAMNFLRNDLLFDADRAIAELRRDARRRTVDDEDENASPPQLTESAGLALLEMYRDVKTGHPEEAIKIFSQSRNEIRRHFGHRVADAHALAARAYDLLKRDEEARQAFADATILAPLSELTRRYPEVLAVAQKYPAAPTPYAQGSSAGAMA
jgi:tetratricopeptide (TPR) repeat protein